MNRHKCVELLVSDNKRQSNLKLDSVHLFIWRSRYEELVIFVKEELVKLVKKETRQNSLEVILNRQETSRKVVQELYLSIRKP